MTYLLLIYLFFWYSMLCSWFMSSFKLLQIFPPNFQSIYWKKSAYKWTYEVQRRRQWQPTPVLLPGKSHGWWSLVGCSPWGSLWVIHDWATSLSLFTFMHWRRKWQPTPVFLLGESQGRGSLWAAVYGVSQSRTRLKWPSSSSQYSCLGNYVDRGAWWAIVHGVPKDLDTT